MAVSRKSLVNLHLILGSFLLPVTAMFAITGTLYTFKITGAYETKTEMIAVAQEATPDLAALTAQAETLLKEKKLDTPTGSAAVKKSGTSWVFEWTGSKLDFTLEPTANPLEMKASYKHTTWHRYFVQLHKAKGGVPFKILAAVLGVGLILLLVSGWMMAQASPQLRKVRLYSTIAGIGAFILAALFS